MMTFGSSVSSLIATCFGASVLSGRGAAAGVRRRTLLRTARTGTGSGSGLGDGTAEATRGTDGGFVELAVAAAGTVLADRTTPKAPAPIKARAMPANAAFRRNPP